MIAIPSTQTSSSDRKLITAPIATRSGPHLPPRNTQLQKIQYKTEFKNKTAETHKTTPHNLKKGYKKKLHNTKSNQKLTRKSPIAHPRRSQKALTTGNLRRGCRKIPNCYGETETLTSARTERQLRLLHGNMKLRSCKRKQRCRPKQRCSVLKMVEPLQRWWWWPSDGWSSCTSASDGRRSKPGFSWGRVGWKDEIGMNVFVGG